MRESGSRQFITLEVTFFWQEAARYTRHPSIEAWLKEVVWDYLDNGPGRFIPFFQPLHWEHKRFTVQIGEEAVRVLGYVSGPFAIYRALPSGELPGKGQAAPGFCLVHLPTGVRLVHLRDQWACQRAADELVSLDVRWDLADRKKLGRFPGARKAAGILERYRCGEAR